MIFLLDISIDCIVIVIVKISSLFQRFEFHCQHLSPGIEGMPAEFYVEAKGTKLDSLTFAVEGPGKAPVEVEETGPSQLTIRYFPEEKGEYVIHVMCEEVDIPTSPFKVKISAKGDASKVYADGPGLKAGCMTGKRHTNFVPLDQLKRDTRTRGNGTPERALGAILWH